jgi:hypothetical protein
VSKTNFALLRCKREPNSDGYKSLSVKIVRLEEVDTNEYVFLRHSKFNNLKEYVHHSEVDIYKKAFGIE